MDRRQRLITRILCGVFIAALIVSGLLVTAHLRHECTGANCPVCAAISAWERLMRSMALTAALGGVLLPGRESAGDWTSARVEGAPVQTLVALKVKLSD